MLALVTAQGARLDAGSVGLAIARSWSDAGRRVLFVDGDTEGSALAERLGEATRTGYSPAERGLPSLIAARRPLTLKLLADHCYNLETPKGSLWSLFAPFHPDGATYAAGWLAERTTQVLDLSRERAVLVASSHLRGNSPLLPLLRLARVVVFVAPVQSPEQATALGELCDEAGLAGIHLQHRLLVVEGASSIPDKTLRAASGLHVVGRLPNLEDDRVLRLGGGRRERAFARKLQELSARLLGLLDVDSSAGAHSDTAGWPRPELFVVAPSVSEATPDEAVEGAGADAVPAASPGRATAADRSA